MLNTAGASNLGVPRRRTIAIQGSGGAYVLIPASINCRYAEIQEMPGDSESGGSYTGAFTAQGINYQQADENYANTYGLTPGTILQLGDRNPPRDRAIGMIGFTYPDGTVRPATPFIKAISSTVTATQVEVREWP
jgi:hypothetical protein